jgi:hypothetical protein
MDFFRTLDPVETESSREFDDAAETQESDRQARGKVIGDFDDEEAEVEVNE